MVKVLVGSASFQLLGLTQPTQYLKQFKIIYHPPICKSFAISCDLNSSVHVIICVKRTMRYGQLSQAFLVPLALLEKRKKEICQQLCVTEAPQVCIWDNYAMTWLRDWVISSCVWFTGGKRWLCCYNNLEAVGVGWEAIQWKAEENGQSTRFGPRW